MVKRELEVKELQLLDASRRRFLNYQQDQLQMELKHLNDEIARKVEHCSSYYFLQDLIGKINEEKRHN